MRVQLFDDFYNENKKKISMSSTYPINWPEVQKWREHMQKDEDAAILADVFITAFRHISFDEFHGALIKGAIEVTALRKKIVLVLYGDLSRSSTWAALLAWPYLKGSVVDVILASELDSYENLTSDHVCVYIDDASYSGKQISETLPYDFDKCDLVILTGAISETARKMILANIPLAKFVSSAIIMKSILETARFMQIRPELYIDQFWILRMKDDSEFRRLFQVHPAVHAVYFDHKLADAVSTMSKVIAIGPDLENDAHNMIKGCGLDKYRMDDRQITKKDYVADFDPDGVCPVAFYKSIDYTWKNAKISKKMHVTMLNDMCTECNQKVPVFLAECCGKVQYCSTKCAKLNRHLCYF